MAQYIDKSALVAEIERRLWLLVPKMTFHQQRVELEKLLSFLDTLEVREVNLEDDVDKILEANDWNFDKIDFYKFAKHFFELGLKVREGA